MVSSGMTEPSSREYSRMLSIIDRRPLAELSAAVM
jgi:hypothetical protein